MPNITNSPATATCTVTRAVLLQLIDAITYTLGSNEYAPPSRDEHDRQLVTRQVDAVTRLAEEIGMDLWSEREAPFCSDEMPVAMILRGADAKFGLPRTCPVPGCDKEVQPCCARPPGLPVGTKWPSAPELCSRHAGVRLQELTRRVKTDRSDHVGPVHAACMPMPSVVDLAPSPEEITGLDAT